MNVLGVSEWGNDPYIEIVEGFKSKTLDSKLWTHEAHLIVGIWFIMNYDPYDALCRIKSGIINYNTAVGGLNTGVNGYHETITIFWWQWISLFVNNNRGMPFNQMVDTFLASTYSDRQSAMQFYLKETLFSSKARAHYVEPDIQEVKMK